MSSFSSYLTCWGLRIGWGYSGSDQERDTWHSATISSLPIPRHESSGIFHHSSTFRRRFTATTTRFRHAVHPRAFAQCTGDRERANLHSWLTNGFAHSRALLNRDFHHSSTDLVLVQRWSLMVPWPRLTGVVLESRPGRRDLPLRQRVSPFLIFLSWPFSGPYESDIRL